MATHVPSTVITAEVDDDLLACSTLARIDHVDAHVVRREVSVHQTPEWWAREILEHTSAAMRVRLRAGWSMLGIGLHHGEPDTVAGWRIADNCTEHVRLQGDSRLGLSGELVTRVTERGVVFATFAQLNNPLARSVWTRVLPGHLAIVRSLLAGAAERAG